MYKRVIFTLHSGCLLPHRQNVTWSQQAVFYTVHSREGSHAWLSNPSLCSEGKKTPKTHKTWAIIVFVGNRLGFCQHQFRVVWVTFQVDGFEVWFPLHIASAKFQHKASGRLGLWFSDLPFSSVKKVAAEVGPAGTEFKSQQHFSVETGDFSNSLKANGCNTSTPTDGFGLEKKKKKKKNRGKT